MNSNEILVRQLSDSVLHEKLKTKIATERELLSEIVIFIQEVDRRRLFQKYNYTNIFDYLVKEMKYSAGSAQRRINAARLLDADPNLSSKLESGDITLAQVSVVASGIRQAKLEHGKICSKEEKLQLIEEVRAKSTLEAQAAVAKKLNLQVASVEKKTAHKDESVRVEMTFSRDEIEQINKVRNLVSHTNPGASFKELYMLGIRELEKKKDPTRMRRGYGLRTQQATQDVQNLEFAQAPKNAGLGKDTKQISAKVRHSIFEKDKRCQWKFANGQTCGSTFQLQVDHKHPKWLGGGNEPENLQLLCSAHNQLKYKQEVGLN